VFPQTGGGGTILGPPGSGLAVADTSIRQTILKAVRRTCSWCVARCYRHVDPSEDAERGDASLEAGGPRGCRHIDPSEDAERGDASLEAGGPRGCRRIDPSEDTGSPPPTWGRVGVGVATDTPTSQRTLKAVRRTCFWCVARCYRHFPHTRGRRRAPWGARVAVPATAIAYNPNRCHPQADSLCRTLGSILVRTPQPDRRAH